MKIKSIAIHGFKSFYEKTKILFDREMSAIVGPNGCGKSNVLDAIRWILGEQNPRQLRAEIMEELISNGSELLKPLGMAEVALVLEEVANYDFEEVEIKRRIFRSGESEYYLNGVTCRLKDITDIFIDTGSGARSYSVIGQGRVDQMITAKPEEKRTLIEEVAGIRKYKIRRRETETRIKTTKENLSRVNDMTEEVKRQMDTLSLQAEQAREFRELSHEAKELELRLHRVKLKKLTEKKEAVTGHKSVSDEAISGLEKEILNVLSQHKKVNSESATLEDEIGELERKNYVTKTELQSKKSSQDLIKSEILNIDAFIEKMVNESELLKEEGSALDTNLNLKKSTLEEVERDLKTLKSDIEQKETELSTLKSDSRDIRGQHEETRKTIFATLDEESKLKVQALGYEKEVEELKLRREIMEREARELDEEKKKTANEISALEGALNDNESSKQRVSDINNRLEQSKASLEKTRGIKTEKLESIKEELNENSSRLNALKQIETNYEWLPEGIRNFMLEHKGRGVLGTVADFISVPEGYEKAAQAALGEKLNWILVEEESKALQAVETLRNNSIGRGTFLAVSEQPRYNDSEVPGGHLKSLSDIVSVKDIDVRVLDNLLGKVVLAPTIEEALRQNAQNPGALSYVTSQGDSVQSNGAISGGASQPGVFERKRETEQLGESIEIIHREILKLSSEIESENKEIGSLVSKIKQNDIELIELGIKEAEIKKDINNLRYNTERLDRRIETVNLGLEEALYEIREILTSLDQTKSKIYSLDSEKSELNAKYKAIEEKIEAGELRERAMEREISNLSISRASLTEKEKNLYEDINDIENRKNDINRRIEREFESIEQKKRERVSFIEKDSLTAEEIKTIEEIISESEEKLLSMKERRAGLLQELTSADEKRESINTELSELRQKNNSFELDLNSIRIEIDNITQSLKNNNIIEDMEEFLSESHEDSVQTESLDLSGEELRLNKLQRKIERFGPVNLLAPEEYNKLEERYGFLTEQIDDLMQALSSLGKAINKIDKESEKRFGETFELMDKKFREIFSRLFRGGEGKLILTEPDNILESGVDVMVRPRGKKLQSINLLSGGEKALSAIALIISACLIKPAPFLLFDEIDAPLDDRNTSYFTELIKEIDRNSQVIIITHNKKTMQEVNSLIGITSNKSGTSTVVSVELN
jgi:chromosome segregation protein